MSVILDILPKFYLRGVAENPLTAAELQLITPKKYVEDILLFEEVIYLNENEPPSSEANSRHGFHKPVSISHQSTVTKTGFDNTLTGLQYTISIQVKALFEEMTKESYLLPKEATIVQKAKAVDTPRVESLKTDYNLQSKNFNEPLNETVRHTTKILPAALLKHHYQIAAILLKQGYTDPEQNVKHHAKSLFSMMFADLTEEITAYINNPSSSLYKIDTLLETIELFAGLSGNACYIPDLAQLDNTQITYSPLSLLLRVYASLVSDHQLMSKLNVTANHIAEIDHSETAYLNAKHLLHGFPTGKTYPFSVNDSEIINFQSQGFYGLFTTKFAKESLEAYVKTLKLESTDDLQISIFEDLASTFSQASLTCEKRVLPETAEFLNQLYHQDATVLLPTGWQGHFVDVVVSKLQSLYLFANSGEQNEHDFSEQNAIGDTIRQLLNPESLDPQFFYDVLTNINNHFEPSLLEKYTISSPIDVIEKEPQQYSNCAWESHCDAIEGLLYIELLNHHASPVNAKALAKEYFQGWDKFHANYVIDNYMKNQPSLPAKALIDILHELKGNELNTKTTHAMDKVTKALQEPLYLHDYQAWLEQSTQSPDNPPTQSPHIDSPVPDLGTLPPAALTSAFEHLPLIQDPILVG